MTPGLGLPQCITTPHPSNSAHHSQGGVRNHSSQSSSYQNCTHLFSPPAHWVHWHVPRGTHTAARGRGALSARLCSTLNVDPKDWPDSRSTWGWGGAQCRGEGEATLEKLFSLFLGSASPRDGAQAPDQFHLADISTGLGHRSSGGAESCPLC